MTFKNVIKFEPINLTQITITFGLSLVIIYSFKTQLYGFFDSLQNCPITVTMSDSEAKVKLDSPVTPNLIDKSITHLDSDKEQIKDWESRVNNFNHIEQFKNLKNTDIYDIFSSLDTDDVAVINYPINDVNKLYFKDKAMLRFLSIVSEKIAYLVFYQNNTFRGMISIDDVVSGLASQDKEYINFGDKLKNGQWLEFPHLIDNNVCFEYTPTIKKLYKRLLTTGLHEIPLVLNGKLIGLLNHKSISDELYSQVRDMQSLTKPPVK